ncbi:hypothetical protein CsatB_028746 [Cannabis sativa]
MDNEGVKKRAKTTSSSSSSSSSSMVAGDDDDRISKLPDSVIIHILSFLPTEDVVQTCILSKRWKLIWYSVPTISFSYNIELKQDQQKFYTYMKKYLKHRKKAMDNITDLVITSFNLKINDFYQRSKAGLLDKWLAFAVENKVKELHLKIGLGKKRMFMYYPEYYYCLPKVVDNATYLTVLELDGVELDTSCSFSFPSLKILSLEEIHQADTSKDNVDVVFKFLLGCPWDVVFKFLLGCPCLEKLRLHNYEFLRGDGKLPLQSLGLKFLELKRTDNQDDLRIEAINLESLVISGDSADNVNLFACKKIRNLSFDDTGDIFELSLNALISNYPLLENLTLRFKYTNDEHLKISGQCLKCFNFKNLCCKPCNITIESAPKLGYFCYEGYLDLSILIEPSNSLSGKIVICEGYNDGYNGYDSIWFTDMLNFLLNLNCSWNTISLHVKEYEALIWPEKLKRVCRSPLLN